MHCGAFSGRLLAPRTTLRRALPRASADGAGAGSGRKLVPVPLRSPQVAEAVMEGGICSGQGEQEWFTR